MRPEANLAKRLTKILCLRLVSWEQRIMMTTQSGSLKSYPRSWYSHATTLQHLRARKVVRRTRSVHSRTRAPAKLVATTMDFRAFVAKAPHLTIPRQRILVYGGKLLFLNATAKIPKAISEKRHDRFSFLNDGNLMSQQEEEPSRYTRTLVVKPALSQMYDQLSPTWKSLEICLQTPLHS